MNFEDANAYIQHKLSKTTAMGSSGISRTIPARVRAHCFFSARVADERVLESIRRVSDDFSSGAITQAEARHKLRLMLKGSEQDNGTSGIGNLASKARINLILTQNKRMAVAVGKYAKDRDPAVEERFPSWKYHVGRNSRDSHAKYDGKVFLKSDPIWRKIFPPWEFNCNCWVENCDEDPVSPAVAQKIAPQEAPESGYEFDPSDAFEDFRLDKYKFDNSPPAIIHAASEAQKMKLEELKRVSEAAGDVVEQSDTWWNGLSKRDRQVILDYTASDRSRLNKKFRAPKRKVDNEVKADGKTPHQFKKERNWTFSKDYDMTNGASAEIDHLSEVLRSGPKYRGVTFRAMTFDKDDEYKSLLNSLDKNIWGLKGFNSSSVTMKGVEAYLRGNHKYKVVFHISGRNGTYLGQHSWIQTDEEVLFDHKIKFRALKPGEKDYIKPYFDKNKVLHICLTEV